MTRIKLWVVAIATTSSIESMMPLSYVSFLVFLVGLTAQFMMLERAVERYREGKR